MQELYNLLSFVNPAEFAHFEGKEKLTPEETREEIASLKDVMKNHVLRRLKSDVFKVREPRGREGEDGWLLRQL